MDLAGLERLRGQIAAGQSVSSDKVGKILKLCVEKSGTKRIQAFYLTACDAQKVREEALIDFMLAQIVTYVLPRAEYHNAKADDYRRIVNTARDTFVKSTKSGEAGELLLYILLESRGIVQLYSKMSLKTSSKMHFHGFDAIHIQVGKNLVMHFGHAKTHASLASGLAEVLDDIQKFNADRKQKGYELRLASRHLDQVKFGEASEQILEILDPYGGDKEFYEEANAVFLGSEWGFMAEKPPNGGKTLEEFLISRYEEDVGEVANKVEKSIDERNDIAGSNFLFLFLPISNIERFRRMFMEELIS